jgi:7-carboxy-7-deazaguanine synthase
LAGTPCTFVRLAGCPLNCNYCDTPQAIPVDSGSPLSISDIITQVEKFGHRLVLVTGGEPLAQRSVIALLQTLIDAGYQTQLETAGAHDISPVPDETSIIMDIKTPESGEAERNRWSNIEQLQNNDEVKIVINSRNDYEWAKNMMVEKGLVDLHAPILLSPSWHHLDAAELVKWILEDHLPVRLQLQQHKYIWGAEKTGV